MSHQTPLPSREEDRPAEARGLFERPRKRPGAGHSWLWICLGAGTFILHLLIGRDSGIVERVYSRGIFVGWRSIWDITLGRSPVPLLYIFIPAAILRAVWLAARPNSPRRPRTARSTWARIKGSCLTAAGWAGIATFSFYGFIRCS